MKALSNVPLTLSLVIPVYNEERHIKTALQAIESQTVKPFEVIVVDNNCTDKTISIAKSFSFVKVLQESNQGRTFARNAGFSAARGDLIGRIDADSVIAKDWVEQVVASFNRDSQLYGLSGMGYSSPLPFVRHPKTSLWTRTYYWFVRSSFRTPTMWGATMAIRRQAWKIVQDELATNDNEVHEDQDLSLCMAYHGLKIREIDKVKIFIDGQTYRYLPKYWRYVKMQRSTLKLHRQKGTFRSRRFPRLSFIQILPGLIGFTLLWGIFVPVFSILMFPVDFIAVRIFSADEWLGNSSN